MNTKRARHTCLCVLAFCAGVAAPLQAHAASREAVEVVLVLVMLNSKVTSPPALTGSSVNSLVKIGAGATNSTSVA